MNAIIELQYLPSIRYFTKFLLYENIIFDDLEAFQKQSYRNRCHISAANGILPLIIPVHRSRSQLPVKEVKIDNHIDWRRMHWQSILSAYGKAPFYEHYIDGLAKYLTGGNRFTYLLDLNLALMEFLLSRIGIGFKVQFLSEKNDVQNATDLRSTIHPKAKYNQTDPNFNSAPYIQVFSDRYGFIPNLSIIDLLFNEGPGAMEMLKRSVKL